MSSLYCESSKLAREPGGSEVGFDEDAASTTSSATVEQDEQDVQNTSPDLSEQAHESYASVVKAGKARPAGLAVGGTTGSTSPKSSASDRTPALANTSDTLPNSRDDSKRKLVTESKRPELLERGSPEPLPPPPTPTSTDSDDPYSPTYPNRRRSFAELERECENKDDEEAAPPVEVQVAGVAKKRTKKRRSTFELIVPIRRSGPQPKSSSRGDKSLSAPVVRRTSAGREVKPPARYSDKGPSRRKQN